MSEFASYGNKRITKTMKEAYMSSLCEKATDLTGKWMLFVAPHKINELWRRIATKVVNGELSCSAKVSNNSKEAT